MIPTVRVHHPNDHDVLMIINELDLRDDHVLWGDVINGSELCVGKGPRGKWYVKQGFERVAGPFDTEAEAEDAAAQA